MNYIIRRIVLWFRTQREREKCLTKTAEERLKISIMMRKEPQQKPKESVSGKRKIKRFTTMMTMIKRKERQRKYC
jgi:hypothetical protein